MKLQWGLESGIEPCLLQMCLGCKVWSYFTSVMSVLLMGAIMALDIIMMGCSMCSSSAVLHAGQDAAVRRDRL